ncbi:uncharacterized protein LOC141537459 [Cotesia typhae]|uniref:uncharacterized protein LOC141537459 n=1 Tax=Cotesia typhae TaxID=2053667 RepID=UPI003D691DD9
MCQCRKNSVQSSPTVCRAFNGEPCSVDEDCAVTNAACIYNECYCNHKFVTMRDYCEPLPFRQLCTYDSDCTEFNTECSTIGECVCKPNHPETNSVECGSWLDDGCLMDQDCLVQNSTCIDDKCQCKSQYVADSKFKCVPIILGSQCRDDVNCSAISNALCSDKKICACAGDSFAIGNLICVPSVGKICSSKQDCVSPFNNCINNKCQCIHNFVMVSNWQCVASNSTFSCKNDYDCGEPWHSECSMLKKCVCKLNSYATNMSTCRPLLGGYCWKDNQCLPENSKCSNFQCKCKNKFVAAANNLCVPLLGS